MEGTGLCSCRADPVEFSSTEFENQDDSDHLQGQPGDNFMKGLVGRFIRQVQFYPTVTIVTVLLSQSKSRKDVRSDNLSDKNVDETLPRGSRHPHSQDEGGGR